MVFVKVLKNKAYFKRFQVQKRRRRQGKTDFKARNAMVRQDKNKYNNKKYRMIVRLTNRKFIVQVAYATIKGDIVVAQANSAELPHYGIPVGLKNYSAAYATGLLCARRCLKRFNLDEQFKGKEECDGEEYHVEDDEESEKRPFKAILDVGLQRTCVGARIWGALKGAVDGGLHVPHTQKNFPGYKAPDDKGGAVEFEADEHKSKIFGGHLQEYMEMMQEEDPTKYEMHFSQFIKNDIAPDGIEEMYTNAHAKIRENPVRETAQKKDLTFTRGEAPKMVCSDGTEHARSKKIGLEARREKVKTKIAAAMERMMNAADDEE